MRYVISPQEQQDLLATVDRNIAMFKTYTGAHAEAVLAGLIDGRAAAVECFAGRLDWYEVPHQIRELRQVMPEWGTRGT
jgi:hypothetical protein